MDFYRPCRANNSWRFISTNLLTYLNNCGVLTLLVLAQMGLVGSAMQTPIDVSYLADNVLVFRYFEAHGEVRQAISMMKKRAAEALSARSANFVLAKTPSKSARRWPTSRESSPALRPRWSRMGECP
jgi:hypothetical protein